MSNSSLPHLDLDEVEVPEIKLKSISFDNVQVFENETFSFIDIDAPFHFKCFHGPNGSGKTTILDAIQLLFANFKGVDKDRLRNRLAKLIRHVHKDENALYDDKKNFTITGKFESSIGDFEVVVDRNGFVKEPPKEIKSIASRICFSARFDQELDIFQLNREQWPVFKDLFESVTGYEIEETKSIFDLSDDPIQAQMLKSYVLGFWVHKPNETISHKECSAGEKKTIKCFSTLLNKEMRPQIILIDNIEMHVESGRHLNLIESVKRCFPDSQIFASTHSHQISRNFEYRWELFDMRLLKANDIVKAEPTRLLYLDELDDAMAKLDSLGDLMSEQAADLIVLGKKLRVRLLEEDHSFSSILNEMGHFLSYAYKSFAICQCSNWEVVGADEMPCL